MILRVRAGGISPLFRSIGIDQEPGLQEFDELERELWEFLEIPSRGDKLRLWSETDARC